MTQDDVIQADLFDRADPFERDGLAGMDDKPAVFNLPAALPFLDELVRGLFARYGRDPLALSKLTLLLPSRRATRAARDAFLRASDGKPMLLPRLSALGDLDADELDLAAGDSLDERLDLPPAISPLRRRLLLARLILAWGRNRGADAILPGQAVALADDLARLIDEAHIEGVDLAGLAALAPADYAEHWQLTLRFLDIAASAWPAILEGEGALDPGDYRNKLLREQCRAWTARPPENPVIAAGFGNASPAVADLLHLIARLPQGAVILPGVDPLCVDPSGEDPTGEDSLRAAVRNDPTHPQYGLLRLLDRIGADPARLPSWTETAVPVRGQARTDLAAEALRPAAETHHWRALPALPADATDGLGRLDCAGPQEEAGVIALLLRERLEVPRATAMLVTPDRGLARRVASELRRWQIEIDDSAGIPLNQTPPGVFLRLLAEAATEDLAPVPLLALLKHPLASGGMARDAFRRAVRRLERAAMRGPRPAPGLIGLRQALAERRTAPDAADKAVSDAADGLLDRLEQALAPFLAALAEPQVELGEILTTHIRAAEALSLDPDAPQGRQLWAQEAGEALAAFIADLNGAATGFEPVAGADYPVLFEALLSGGVLRPRYGRHPRLQILGTLEARLQQADLVVLGGLNEASWPAAPSGDPWLSRPMRQALGLPPEEARIGLSAHDFAMAFNAREVVMTRAARSGGAPTVPSRWLLRLDTVLRGSGAILDRRYERALDWQPLLDRPDAFRPTAAPEPRPPVHKRPRRLSVTEIETWMRDPYAIYARRILKLEPLDPLDADPGLAERGVFIHGALDAFVRRYPKGLPPKPDAELVQELTELGREQFGAALARPGVWAFWWPRFLRVAAWFVETERARGGLLAESLAERRGELVLAGDFKLYGKADRIDRRRDGQAMLIDYKTGTLPSSTEVESGLSPQLPLEAAMLAAGGFAQVPAMEVAGLEYWRLSGGDPPGEIKPAGGPKADPKALAEQALDGLERLIAAFDDEATPYRARPRPEAAPRYGRYGHLARLGEWGGAGGDS